MIGQGPKPARVPVHCRIIFLVAHMSDSTRSSPTIDYIHWSEKCPSTQTLAHPAGGALYQNLSNNEANWLSPQQNILRLWK